MNMNHVHPRGHNLLNQRIPEFQDAFDHFLVFFFNHPFLGPFFKKYFQLLVTEIFIMVFTGIGRAFPSKRI